MTKHVLTICMLLFSVALFGQWTYNISNSIDGGNPPGPNTGTADATTAGYTSIIAGSQSANQWSAPTPIGFPFNFFGVPVTQFQASGNGLITFNTGSPALPAGNNNNLPDAGLPDQTIAVLWDEFTAAPPTGSNDQVYYQVFGTAPNRQLWVKWYSYEMGNPSVSFSYFACVLEEGTDNIYVIDEYSTTSASLTYTTGVQENATNAVQFGGINTLANAGNGSSTADNDWYLYEPVFLSPDNVGVSAIVNPMTPVVPGAQNTVVEVTNFGTNVVTSFDVDWTVDGIAQPQFNYTGSLAGGASTNVTLGSYTYTADSTEIIAWTSNPNGVADSNNPDDTLSIVVCGGLSGTYTVGGAAADFLTLNDAVDALACGVSGPVVFDIAPGAYAEYLTIGEVAGSSATNTITFNGGGAASIDHDGLVQPAAILINGGDHMIFQDLTINLSANTDTWGIRLNQGADFIQVIGCTFNMDPTATSDVIGIVGSADALNDFAEGNNCNELVVFGCTFNGGDMGIHIEGVTTTPNFLKRNTINNNTILNYNTAGIYIDNADTLTIRNNYVETTRGTFGDGIYIFDVMAHDVSFNQVYTPDYGIYISDGNFDGTITRRGSVNNNMVRSTTDYGIYLDDVNDTDLFHNTSFGRPGIRINDFLNFDVRNNIFASDTDYAFESDDIITVLNVFDYNIYYAAPGNALFVKEGAPAYADLAAWQLANASININSLEGDPVFVSNNDLHLIGALANDAGDNTVGVTLDIDGDMRPLAPATVVDIGADEYLPNFDDAQAIAVISPTDLECGDAAMSVEVVVRNLGLSTISNLPISVEVTGDAVASLSGTVIGPLAFNEYDTLSIGTFNTFSGGTFTVTAIMQLPGDQDVANDTVVYTFNTVSSEAPMGMGDSVCIGDAATLMAIPAPNAMYAWYDSLSGGNMLSQSMTFNTGPITADSTVYLGYFRQSAGSLVTTNAGGNGCGGGNMFDVVANSSLRIDSLYVTPNNAGANNVTIHYITGSSYLGNETNAAAWTTVGTYTVNTTAADQLVNVDISATPINLPAGVTVAIYAEYDANYTSSSNTYSDANITITTGAGLCGSFATVNPGREFNGEVFYNSSAPPCNPTRVPVTASVVAYPVVNLGADTTFCDNVSVMLDAGNPGLNFNWSTGGMMQMESVNASGDYWVDVTNSTGCTTRDSLVATTNPTPAYVGASVDTVSCFGEADANIDVFWFSGMMPFTYSWASGETTEDLINVGAGTYSGSITDANGCMNSTGPITVVQPASPLTVSALVEDDTFGNSGSVDLTIAGGTGPYMVTWSNGATTEDLSGLAPGTYVAAVTDAAGCTEFFTAVVTAYVSVGQIQVLDALNISPNPASELAIIDLELSAQASVGLQVFDALGDLITSEATEQTMSRQYRLDVSSFAAGVYLLQFNIDGQMITKRLIVTQ